MYLKGFVLGGYRSFGEPQWIAPLGKVNILAGTNNSGKSNILRFASSHLGRLTGGAAMSGNQGRFDPIRDRHIGSEAPFTVGLAIETDNDHIDQIADPTVRQIADRITGKAGDGAWFIKQTPDFTAPLTASPNHLSSISKRATEDEWRRLWATIRGSSGGSFSQHWLPETLELLDPFRTNTPTVSLVPAIRQVDANSEADDSDGLDLSGAGIIDRLARLQNPGVQALDNRERFQAITSFVRVVTGYSDAEIEVPYERDTILVHHRGLILPLESLGTGIHEVVILAVAATVLREQLLCIEEPEIHLHPSLQRQLIQYLFEKTDNQYLITTHSAHILDSPNVNTFHVQLSNGETRVTQVGNLAARSALSAQLGVRASDIVQANSVIWVEGPSDRLYVRHWLNEIDDSLIEGAHYAIMFYGGRLMSHISGNQLDEIDQDLISLLTLNQNSYLIIDSDRAKKGAQINRTKSRLIKDFDGRYWVTQGREVENYLSAEMMREAVALAHTDATSTATGLDPYEQSLMFERPSGSRFKEQAEADKMKVARYVIAQPANLGVLNLRSEVTKLATFVRNANSMA